MKTSGECSSEATREHLGAIDGLVMLARVVAAERDTLTRVRLAEKLGGEMKQLIITVASRSAELAIQDAPKP